MGIFIENMNDFTAKLFCSPVDAETAKSEVKLNLSFAKLGRAGGSGTPGSPAVFGKRI
jgi:hypothetical protein